MRTTQTELKPFVAALTNACRFIDARMSIPILGMVLVKVGSVYVELESTDLDNHFTHHMPNLLGGPGETAKFLLPGRDLLKLCKAAVKDYDLISFLPDDKGVTVEFGDDFSSRFDNDLPVKDFPDAGQHRDFKHAFKMSRDDLTGALRMTLPFASTEETRYYLNGVHLTNDDPDGTVRFVATDGHRLSAFTHTVPVNGGWPEKGVIVPLHALNALQGILKPLKDGDCLVAFAGDTHCRITTPVGMLTVKLIDGTFPDYHRVIPTSNNSSFQFASRDALIKGIDQVTALTDKERAIKIAAGVSDKIDISCSSPEGSTSRKALVGWAHNDAPEFGCNARYLQDIARLKPDEGPVTVKVNGPNDPMLVDLGIENHTMVLMPMRV